MIDHRWTLKRLCPLVLGIIVLALPLGAADRLVGISYLKTRAVALGGAFTAVSDPLAAWEFNPAGAGFRLDEERGNLDLKLYFNALAPALIWENRHDLENGQFLLGGLIKGFRATLGPFKVGGILGEEMTTDVRRLERDHWLDAQGYTARRNSSLGIALALGGRVSIGASAELFRSGAPDSTTYKLGYRYGVQVRTRSRIDIGLFFADFPIPFERDRLEVERFGDETLNVGVAYRMADWATLSLDLRNVSDEGKPAVREPHGGLEIRPVPFLSLRGGYFIEKSGTDWISAGIGLGDVSQVQAQGIWSHFRVEASMLLEKADTGSQRWWFVTTLISL